MKKIVLLISASVSCLLLAAQSYRSDDHSSIGEKLNNEYCSNLFRSCDGVIFDLTGNDESAQSYRNILNWLNGRAAGLQIFYARDGTPVPFIRNTRAVVFLDEEPVTPWILNDLSVEDIAMVKIIKEPFVGAVANGGGVIAIYTKRGDDDGQPEE